MKDTNRIRVLSDRVANKIAAGEVVERPASVLKELLENAIDAEATQVDAEVVAGGKTLIRVSDNGVGMDRDNALLCIERFATSKIRDVEEIERIASLGFRGEALAAISSVSRFSLRTRLARDLAGTEIIMSGGKIQEVRDQGCAPGTVVSVRNLFFNVPARRKFVRSQQTELFHIRQVFMLYALSHPETAMTLAIDGRKTVNLPGRSGLDQRLQELYPSGLGLALRRVEYSSSVLHVSGYASLPTHTRSDKSEQYLFVNGRPTGAPVLGYAIREAYRGLLPKDRHSMLFLFISIDPAMVDVNVHPTKKEVRFHNSAGVRDAIIAAVRQALSTGVLRGESERQPRDGADKSGGEHGNAAVFSKRRPDIDRSSLSGPGLFRGASAFDNFPRFSYPRTSHPASAPDTQAQNSRKEQTGRPANGETACESKKKERESPWSWMRIVGQVCGIYIVMETEEGLVLMDPHAAHERILYEKFMAGISSGRIQSHALLLPETVELAPRDAHILRSHIETLKNVGFGIAEFGGDTFVVDALPASLSGISPARLLTDLTAGLEEAGEKSGVRPLIEERIAQAACKSAVKARKDLSSGEMEKLVAELGRMEMPYTCPHGRPTIIHISRQELDKKFGRA